MTVLVVRRRFSNTIHVVISTILDRDLVEAVTVVSSVLPANLPDTKYKLLYWLNTLEEFISSVGICCSVHCNQVEEHLGFHVQDLKTTYIVPNEHDMGHRSA